MKKILYLLLSTICVSCTSEKQEISETGYQSVTGIADTIDINVGIHFTHPNQTIKFELFDELGYKVTSLINDSTVIITALYNYNIDLNIVSLSKALEIEKVGSNKFQFKPHIDNIDSYKRRPRVDFAFIVNKSKNIIFYHNKKLPSKKHKEFKEWTEELDTVAQIGYQVKTF